MQLHLSFQQVGGRISDAPVQPAATGTAHILNGLGIDSDLAPSAIGVFKIGVGVYNRNSSSIGSTTHANSTQQQNQQQQQQTPKRMSSQSGRKPT